MAKRSRLNLQITELAEAGVRQVAVDLGLVTVKGSQVRQGSISALLEGIGRGELIVTRRVAKEQAPLL